MPEPARLVERRPSLRRAFDDGKPRVRRWHRMAEREHDADRNARRVLDIMRDLAGPRDQKPTSLMLVSADSGHLVRAAVTEG